MPCYARTSNWILRIYRLSSLYRRGQIYTPEEQEDIEEVCQLLKAVSEGKNAADGMSNLRAPLHLALFISPIYLLIPISLLKKSYNRQTMISISRALGNRKPEIILQVEKLIWETVFALATGSQEPLHLLQQLSNNLPWEEIQQAQALLDIRTWFKLGKSWLCFAIEYMSLILYRCVLEFWFSNNPWCIFVHEWYRLSNVPNRGSTSYPGWNPCRSRLLSWTNLFHSECCLHSIFLHTTFLYITFLPTIIFHCTFIHATFFCRAAMQQYQHNFATLFCKIRWAISDSQGKCKCLLLS